MVCQSKLLTNTYSNTKPKSQPQHNNLWEKKVTWHLDTVELLFLYTFSWTIRCSYSLLNHLVKNSQWWFLACVFSSLFILEWTDILQDFLKKLNNKASVSLRVLNKCITLNPNPWGYICFIKCQLALYWIPPSHTLPHWLWITECSHWNLLSHPLSCLPSVSVFITIPLTKTTAGGDVSAHIWNDVFHW